MHVSPFLSLSLSHTHTHTHTQCMAPYHQYSLTYVRTYICKHTHAKCAMGTGQVKYNLMSTMYIILDIKYNFMITVYIILDLTMLHIKLNSVRSCIQLFHELVTHAHTYTQSDKTHQGIILEKQTTKIYIK